MNDPDQEEISKRRGIYLPSFLIYGGVSGLYDYGPYGSRIKDNVIRIWKDMMLSEGNVAEYDGTSLTQISVLKASGHYDRFFDYSTECENCHTKFRVDDLLEKRNIEVRLDQDYLTRALKDNDIKCDKCGGELGEVKIHKLMFQVEQGQNSDPLFLRPETAQGIFVNFKEYYRFFREKLPFAIIQVGRGYRNEISPRKALYRLREFNMMECESFFDPENERWVNEPPDSFKVKLAANTGEEFFISPREAYERQIVKSQPLAYFIGKSFQFYVRIGLDPDRIRYRQHKKDELSHYSSDTWDAEALTSTGWIEITGIAHRGTYDLSRHIETSGKDLYAQRVVPSRKVMEEEVDIDYGLIKKKFVNEAPAVISALKNNQDFVTIKGEKIKLAEFLIKSHMEKIIDRENFIPTVIEPSFGLDRIIYSLFDQNFTTRAESGFNVLRIPSEISPYEAVVLPLMPNDSLDKVAREVFSQLLAKGGRVLYDESGSIGKRYARYDEVGIVYGITIDYDTLKDNTVTLRHRDTREQIRIPIKEIMNYVRSSPWNGKKN